MILNKEIDVDVLDVNVTLTNFSNSILKHYGVPTFHSSIKETDDVLKNHRKIAVFLFDGAGEYNLSLYPKTNKFILSHGYKNIHSVNPATTVAATTSFLSALYPVETSWLGWSLDFPSIGVVDTFTGYSSYTKELIDKDLMKKTAPYKSIITLLNENNVKAKAYFEYPIENKEGPKNYKDAINKFSSFFTNGGEFLYGYFKNPDATIHKYGVKSLPTWWQFKKISIFLKRFVKQNPDVLVFSLADHGLIDVIYKDLSDYPEIESTLSHPISLDARIPTFFVKDDKKKEFEENFNKVFGNDFLLVKKEDILNSTFFGEGVASKQTLDFIGDYVGISKSNVVLKEYFGKKDKHPLRAHHSGISSNERDILLSVYNS